jgi:hypothetical protein
MSSKYAPVQALPLTIETLDVLQQGTTRQRDAFKCITEHHFLSSLAEFRGVLISTVALGIYTPQSDLDLICEAHDLDYFSRRVTEMYTGFSEFKEVKTPNPEQSRCYSLRCDDFEIEIFGSRVRLEDQFGYRHYLAMARLINIGGEGFRDKLQRAKLSGMKTEPAIASILGLEGDPYESVAGLADLTEGEFSEVLSLSIDLSR